MVAGFIHPHHLFVIPSLQQQSPISDRSQKPFGLNKTKASHYHVQQTTQVRIIIDLYFWFRVFRIILYYCNTTKITYYTLTFTGDHSIVWRKGHEVLSAAALLISRDPRYKLHKNDFSLELQNIRPNDAGDFVCQLSTLGEAMEVAHTVEVLGSQLIQYDCSNVPSVLYRKF